MSLWRWPSAVATIAALVSSTWIDPETVFTDFAPTTKSSYTQLVDHSSYNVKAQTFKQRYWAYDRFWRGGGPILFFFSGEGALETFYKDSTVLFSSLGPELGGLIVFLEHRYYGQSKIQNNLDLQYLTVENALQDTAEFLDFFKSVNNCTACKTFVFGGSYGGMLVGWFRMKYPHLTSGGVVSSGSLDFYDIEQIPKLTWENALSAWSYEGGEECSDTVKKAFNLVEAMGSREAELVQIFNVCVDDRSKSRLPGGGLPALIRYLKGGIASLSMIDYPFEWTLTTKQPARPVKGSCDKIVQYKNDDYGLLSALSDVVADYTGPTVKCKNIGLELFDHNEAFSSSTTQTVVQANKNNSNLDMELWNYQACTQVPMMPLSTDLLGFFPPSTPAELRSLKKACSKRYNVQTRETYMPLTYGGTLNANDKVDWTKVLTRVVIVDGALDTWRTGSAGSWVHRNTTDFVVIPPVRGSAHHQDLIAEHSADTAELKAARRLILDTLRRWLHEDTKMKSGEARHNESDVIYS